MEKLKIDLTPSLKRLEIVTKNLVSSKVVGRYKSVFRGKGLEFDSYREYTQDDDATLIDWKASIRSNEILIKQFIEERNLTVFLLIDVSSSMMLGTTHQLKMEYTAELAASLGYAILQASDSLGFAFFSDKIVKKVSTSMGKGQFYVLSKALVNLELYGGNYDLANALKFGFGYIPQQAMVFILSDFIGLKGDWKRYIRIFAKKFDVIGIMIRDPIDRALPEYLGQVVLEDPFSDEQAVIKPHLINPHYKSYVTKQEREIREAFISSDADFIEIVTNKPFESYIIELFRKRSRKFR